MGDIYIVSNSGYLGARELLPKAHPNDGVMDVLAVKSSMPYTQRLQAWRRIPTSSHIPHPDISTKQTEGFSWPVDEDDVPKKAFAWSLTGKLWGRLNP